MRLLTQDAVLVCKHELGRVAVVATQDFVTIADRRILLEPDPPGRPIAGCPLTVPFKPCLTTLTVERGYSDLIRVSGRRVCLETVSGFTDGTPPGTILYKVRSAGQDLVEERA